MIHIQFDETFAQFDTAGFREKLQSAAEAVLRFTGTSPCVELSIVITSNEQIRILNRQYRGIDAATDVLSFPAEEIDPETGNAYLGDILIAYPYASDQAAAEGHSIDNEMQLLVVHGTLHLLGYDHVQDSDRQQMWQTQAEILKDLGNPNGTIPA
ncbi:MAG: rRNA maturation RNase YbeY [Chloroflexi bacterium]|nr:rRNA maturation RNase YbeY [Chloroflexota bacterium]